MKPYKGFNKDMTCQGFQYEEGKTYETNRARCCFIGFHACEDPIDCLRYYGPDNSEYHEVECEGQFDYFQRFRYNNGFACTKIKIGKKLNIIDIVNKTLKYRKEKRNLNTIKGYRKISCSMDEHGVSQTIGPHTISATTGDFSVSCTRIYDGIACSTGNFGISYSTDTGNISASTGVNGVSMVEGERGVSCATGGWGYSDLKGNFGIACTTGRDGCSCVEQSDCVAVAWGTNGKAKGATGSYLVLADWLGSDFKGAQMVRVDGKKIKANTWYTMVNGEIVEA